MRYLVCAIVLLCIGCTERDRTGRELTDSEQMAVETCNDWLSSKLQGTVGYIRPSKSYISSPDDEGIFISWDAETAVGSGMVMCTTDAEVNRVIGGMVDGIAFKP